MLSAARLLFSRRPTWRAGGIIVLWIVSSLIVAAKPLRGAEAMPAKSEALGRVSGRVLVAGQPPRTRPLPVFKNRDFCGATVANETLLVARDGGLRNAVVVLAPWGAYPVAEARTVVLDNKNCAFVPHVQVAAVGSDVILKNSDPILHTIHARLGQETLFNVGLPHWRQVTKALTRAGVVRVDCDVLHTWMSAAIVVTSSPYYAITDEKGEFVIDKLPPGGYEMEVWHERLGTRGQGVSLKANGHRYFDVVYAPARGNP